LCQPKAPHASVRYCISNQLVDALGLSYKNSKELNAVIDDEIPAQRPRFQRHEIEVAGERIEVYYRDILECIKTLWSDPELTPHLILKPERHYTDATKTVRMFHDMHTGKWWWATQVCT
jgi:hypothetical protein